MARQNRPRGEPRAGKAPMGTPALQRIRRYAQAFRRALELCRTQLPIRFRTFPRGTCGDVCTLLAAYFAEEGLGIFEEVCGPRKRGNQTHAWLRQGSVIVDITADQFRGISETAIVGDAFPLHGRFVAHAHPARDFRLEFPAELRTEFEDAYTRLRGLANRIVNEGQKAAREYINSRLLRALAAEADAAMAAEYAGCSETTVRRRLKDAGFCAKLEAMRAAMAQEVPAIDPYWGVQPGPNMPFKNEAIVRLDCTTPDTTLTSLAVILGIDATELHRRIRSFDLEDFCERNPSQPKPACDVVAEHIVGANPAIRWPQLIRWFHATRVPPSAAFADGIQPLSLRLSQIWTFLGQLALQWTSPEAWSRFQAHPDGSGLAAYSLKVTDPTHQGPYAFLIRDVPLRPRDTLSHDYLGVPEIVADIGQSFTDQFGHDLREAYRQATCSCLVHFDSDVPREDAVWAALYYVYRATWGTGLCIEANTCFDGEGKTIPRDRIVKVEFLPDRG